MRYRTEYDEDLKLYAVYDRLDVIATAMDEKHATLLRVLLNEWDSVCRVMAYYERQEQAKKDHAAKKR